MNKDNLYDYCVELYEEKMFPEVIGILTKACKRYPKNTDFAVLLASCYNKIHKFTHAAKILLEADAIKPDDTYINYNLGYSLICMEKVSEGIKYLEKCLSLKPPKDIKNMAKRMIESKDEFNEYNKNEISMEEEFICEDRFLNAQECLYSGRLDDAISLYGEILNNKPEHASSIMNIGLCMLKKGKIRKSIPYFEKASRLDTSCTLSLANLMHAYHRLGDNEKSRFYADQVMKKIKNLALREIIRLVGLFIEVGDFTNARKIINKYPDYDCSTQLIFLSGILYAKRKKYESALEEFLSIKNESKIANEYFKKTKEIIDGKIKDFNFKPKIIEWGIDII